MRLGVLGFSYATFPHFETDLSQQGSYTVNLGDNAQTIAARQLFLRCGARPEQVVRIDRDTLSTYDGPEVHLLMNGAFRGPEFPIAPNIRPRFLGFSARLATLQANADYLRAHQPIGCRDTVTRDHLKALGIEAFVSGCVSMTLEPPDAIRRPREILVVHGSGAGHLPTGLVDAMPAALRDRAVFISHRLPVHEYPLSSAGQDAAETHEAGLIDRYYAAAELVVTPLHHVAAPCIGLGVPVVLARATADPRFSYLETLLPVYQPDQFDQIDWAPRPVDAASTKAVFTRAAKDMLRDAQPWRRRLGRLLRWPRLARGAHPP